MNGTAVAVLRPFIGEKYRQTGDWVPFPVDLYDGLLPLKLMFKACLPEPRVVCLQPPFMQRPVRFSSGWMDGHS